MLASASRALWLLAALTAAVALAVGLSPGGRRDEPPVAHGAKEGAATLSCQGESGYVRR